MSDAGTSEIDEILQILDKHFPNSDWPEGRRITVAVRLRNALHSNSIFGISQGHNDPKQIDRIEAALRRSLSAFDGLSEGAKRDLNSTFRFKEFGNDRQTLSDWNVEITARSAIEMLIEACTDAQDHSAMLSTVGIRPTKADVKAIGLIDACRRAWWAATAEHAPRYLVKAKDLGGDASRSPPPFDLFTRDIFGFHGISVNSIPAAMDAWRKVRGTDAV